MLALKLVVGLQRLKGGRKDPIKKGLGNLSLRKGLVGSTGDNTHIGGSSIGM